MALKQDKATDLAKELMLTMAQSGTLPIQGNGGNAMSDRATRRGEVDAAYLTSLYFSLVSGLQK